MTFDLSAFGGGAFGLGGGALGLGLALGGGAFLAIVFLTGETFSAKARRSHSPTAA